jgi:hypothetical protein
MGQKLALASDAPKNLPSFMIGFRELCVFSRWKTPSVISNRSYQIDPEMVFAPREEHLRCPTSSHPIKRLHREMQSKEVMV